MHHFHDRGQGEDVIGLVAEQAGSEHGQQGAQAFASGMKDMFGNAPDRKRQLRCDREYGRVDARLLGTDVRGQLGAHVRLMIEYYWEPVRAGNKSLCAVKMPITQVLILGGNGIKDVKQYEF